jgi:hypothetical protein
MDEYLLVFTDSGQDEEEQPITRGLKDRLKPATEKASAVAVKTLQENMCRFLASLDTVLKTSPKEVAGMTLEEVEIQVQVDGKGNVGIAGIFGSEISAQGGIKFILRKKLGSS